MSSFVTVTDLFCGAGGSSTAAVLAGAEVKLAINHWPRALETHNLNHPKTTHICTDISTADPRKYPQTSILIASPECTNHSLAKGKQRKLLGQQPSLWGDKEYDPAEERSRCTMWDPLRFCEQLGHRVVILENVVDARNWRMWDAWLHAWQSLDYDFEIVYFNSQFAHPTPQSRDRMYFVAWKRGQRKPDLTICPLAHCARCDQDVEAVQCWKNPGKRYGKYRQQYLYRCPNLTCGSEVTPYYYPAASAIDWCRPVQRISERKRPLKEKTLTRIEDGLKRFALEPFLMGLHHQRTQASSTSAVWPTQTTYDDTSLVTPAPFLIDHIAEYRARSINQPLSTVVGGGNHQSLVVPPSWLMSYYSHGAFTSVEEPVPTVTTLDRCALVTQHSEKPRVQECGFRMLEPQEIQAAMAFPRDYVVTGSRREKVKQLGNAVTPPVMKILIERILAVL